EARIEECIRVQRHVEGVGYEVGVGLAPEIDVRRNQSLQVGGQVTGIFDIGAELQPRHFRDGLAGETQSWVEGELLLRGAVRQVGVLIRTRDACGKIRQ